MPLEPHSVAHDVWNYREYGSQTAASGRIRTHFKLKSTANLTLKMNGMDLGMTADSVAVHMEERG